MNQFIGGVIAGVILGVGGYWLFDRVSQPSAFEEVRQRPLEATTNLLRGGGATNVPAGMRLTDRLEAMDLEPETIREEMAKTGKVVRGKPRGGEGAVVDKAADVVVVAAVKAKLLADAQMPAWDVTPQVTNGVVTLSGTVWSVDSIGRAMLIALETEGVNQVVSTLQVKDRPSRNSEED
jgi:hypothetical protein